MRCVALTFLVLDVVVVILGLTHHTEDRLETLLRGSLNSMRTDYRSSPILEVLPLYGLI